MHVGGQDMPAHDPRHSSGHVWGYIINATPARHTASQIKDGFDMGVPTSPMGNRLDRIDPWDWDANATQFVRASYYDRVWTSAGLCIFSYYPETLPFAETISAITGWDFTIEEAEQVGQRIQNLLQAFNIREGISPSAWKYPKRLSVPQSTGPNEGRGLDSADIKKKAYTAFGWDPETGQPLDSTLEDVGLDKLIHEFSHQN